MSRRPTRPWASGSLQPDGHRVCRHPAALQPPPPCGSARRYPPTHRPPAATPPRNAPSPHRAKRQPS
eukprot:4317062-Pleurochrysis_carterae.AAC.1